MKYKFKGADDSFCIELLAYGIQSRNKYLNNGDIVDVPDDNSVVINALDASGVFERVTTAPKVDKKRKK